MPEERLPAPFEVVTETEVDSRSRVSLGRAGAEPGRRYRVWDSYVENRTPGAWRIWWFHLAGQPGVRIELRG